jgi:hypothetical protein
MNEHTLWYKIPIDNESIMYSHLEEIKSYFQTYNEDNKGTIKLYRLKNVPKNIKFDHIIISGDSKYESEEQQITFLEDKNIDYSVYNKPSDFYTIYQCYSD